MGRNNTIGIVGHITAPPGLILDAPDWTQKVYETTLERTRPSGTTDTYILRFSGRSAGTREELEKIKEGAEVLVGGEIRTENVHDPKPEENRVKVYIYAEIIAANAEPVEDQNEVRICGRICKTLYSRNTRRGEMLYGIVVAVNTPESTGYIPCVCFGREAYRAGRLKIGSYVEIYGRFLSRTFKKKIEGRELPFLQTVYEVSVIKLKTHRGGHRKRKEEGA